MARIVKVWGPSRVARRPDRLVWTFSAQRENGTTAMYRLSFFLDSRSFRTSHLGEDKQATDYAQVMHTLLEPTEGVYDGRVTDLLRSRLSPEQIAEATAAALTYRRK